MPLSKDNHNTEMTILLVMAALVVGVMWLSLNMSRRSGPAAGLPSSRNSNTEGGLLYYALCERLGYTLRRNTDVFEDALLEEAGVLVLLSPYVTLHPAEQQQLRNWLAGGGVLVTDEPQTLLEEVPYVSYKSVAARQTGGRVPKAIVSTIPEEADAGILSRDVTRIVFEERQYFDDDAFADARADHGAAVLLRDSSGIRIMEYPFGRGRLICLADISFLTNECLVYHDNPVLAVNLTAYALSRAANQTIVYDEYHYGAGHTKTGMGILTGSLFKTSAGWAILCVFAAGILWLCLQGRRFGARLPLYQQKKRRSKLEFIDALAATYKAAAAHRFCLQMLDGWFREKLTAALGLPLRASNAALAAAAGGDNDELKQRIENCLNQSDQLLTRDKISERSLLKITHQFKKIEGEVYREHSRRVPNR